MSKRRRPNADEREATLLLIVWDLQTRLGIASDPIPFEVAQQMTAHQICTLVHYDHAVYHTWGGGMHPTNLTPRLIAEHRTKTRNDLKIIAKVKRAAKREAAKEKLLPANRNKLRKKLNGDVVLRDGPTMTRVMRLAIGELRWLGVSDDIIANDAKLPVDAIRGLRRQKPCLPFNGKEKSRGMQILSATGRVKAEAYKRQIGYAA